MTCVKRQPNECLEFQSKKVSDIGDFWSWAYSDLQSNIIRSIFAEYIVALALGITDKVREEWNPYDLQFCNIRVEVKAAAYVQSWNQGKLSNPVFSIAPAISRGDGVSGIDNTIKRRSDVYVFCLHNCKEKNLCNPLNLDQWDFYCVPTKYFNDNMPYQKTLSLAKLVTIARPIKFSDIKTAIIEAV